ncbi:unnamed protein product [Oikopleura dioica]|uniref:Uncharacterized protein n=1 Tax=Oikopleura dioica TaxID=34765 RepID=E4WWP1_OIKDI|nr:unnamed protein product [Oikopleura dioica]
MSSLSYSEMDSFVSIFSDATHSDCGSVFSDEPTSECIETDFELQEQMDISDPEENIEIKPALNEDLNQEAPITKPRSKFEEKSSKIISSSLNPAKENVSPPKKVTACTSRRTFDGSMPVTSAIKSTKKEEFIPEFKLRAGSLRSTASTARSSEKENFLAPRQRSASELKMSFRSAVLSPNRFENRKKVFDNPSESSRKRFANRERVVPKIEPPQFSHNKMEMIKNRFEEKAGGGKDSNQFEMSLMEEDREEQKRRHQQNMMKFQKIFQ